MEEKEMKILNGIRGSYKNIARNWFLEKSAQIKTSKVGFKKTFDMKIANVETWEKMQREVKDKN